MIKAVWKNTVIAESSACEIVEGNYYFPPGSVIMEYFRESATTTTCFWKGKASYYDIVLGDEVNNDPAWYYPSPKKKASKIKGFIAFWGDYVGKKGDNDPYIQIRTNL